MENFTQEDRIANVLVAAYFIVAGVISALLA